MMLSLSLLGFSVVVTEEELEEVSGLQPLMQMMKKPNTSKNIKLKSALERGGMM
jgi:hypothetical protein